MAKETKKKDHSIIYNLKYYYKVSEDLISLGDYYLDFKLHGFSDKAIQRCDTTELRDHINKTYTETEWINRLSAKIIASDDPELNKNGVLFLVKDIT